MVIFNQNKSRSESSLNFCFKFHYKQYFYFIVTKNKIKQFQTGRITGANGLGAAAATAGPSNGVPLYK